MTNQQIKSIRKALKTSGEAKIGNIEIMLDGINEAEITRDGVYLFSATTWAEVEEFLLEMEENNEQQ